jgi:hypothetical protein
VVSLQALDHALQLVGNVQLEKSRCIGKGGSNLNPSTELLEKITSLFGGSDRPDKQERERLLRWSSCLVMIALWQGMKICSNHTLEQSNKSKMQSALSAKCFVTAAKS